MRGASQLPTYIGRIIIAVGFVMIVIAWDGAASLDFIQGQFPYLLSGAMPGLALIIVGAGLEYVQTVRQATAQRAKQMAELNLSVVKLIGYVKETGGLIQGEDAEIVVADDESRLRVIDNAGHAFEVPVAAAATAVAQASTAVAERDEEQKATPAEEMVIAGRSSFHDPECHLVSGRDDMATISRLQAEAQSLAACRVCKP